MLNFYNYNNNRGQNKMPDILKNGAVTPPGQTTGQSNFAKYKDPTGEFTAQELKWGFLYVKNKALFYKIMVIFLLSLDAAFIIFGLWRWGSYFLGWQDFQRVQSSLSASVNYLGIHPRYSAQPVQVVNTQIFSSRENTYDAVAELINPNDRFLVNFDYYFVVNGEKTPVQKTFLLPGEIRPVAYLGIKDGVDSAPVIVLENSKYERISEHKVTDTRSWQEYRLNFQVSDFIFLKSLAQAGQNTDAVQFKLTNASPYNFVGPNFYAVLLQNGQMAGILPLHLDSINSLETKNIDLRNFAAGLSISEIALYPIINVYDEGVYLSR